MGQREGNRYGRGREAASGSKWYGKREVQTPLYPPPPSPTPFPKAGLRNDAWGRGSQGTLKIRTSAGQKKSVSPTLVDAVTLQGSSLKG